MPLLYGVVFVDLPDAVLPLLNLYKQLYKNRRWLCGFCSNTGLGTGGGKCVWGCGATAATPRVTPECNSTTSFTALGLCPVPLS